MSHMVIYRGSDGKPGYHQTDDIHDAVGFVEQMRNDQGVEHARIFRLEEVVFQYKPYYRVELAELGLASGETNESIEAGSSGLDAAGNGANGTADGASGNGTADATVGADDASADAKRGLFGR